MRGCLILWAQASANARERGFARSCAREVGRYLAALAAAVPAGGRVLELGTGVGVGSGWLVHGLGARPDVEITTVELDPTTADVAARVRVTRRSSASTSDGRRDSYLVLAGW